MKGKSTEKDQESQSANHEPIRNDITITKFWQKHYIIYYIKVVILLLIEISFAGLSVYYL